MNTISRKSTSNIALVKYWGKKGHQTPMNPSISMTLKHAITETSIAWTKLKNSKEVNVSLLFEGQENTQFEKRLQLYINHIVEYIPSLKGLELFIESSNSFPHSSGIASSASAMSALAFCLIELEKNISGKIYGFEDELRKASFIARLGSGSAARSIYKGYTMWGKSKAITNSSDEYAIPINEIVNPVFNDYYDAILIVSDKQKIVGSSVGHELMQNHPFAESRFNQANNNIIHLVDILKSGEQMEFALLVESEALSLHAMMMTSNPSFILLEPNTLKIIKKIQEYRIETKIPVCFTLDAGANVHLLYHGKNRQKIVEWIITDLKLFCHNNRWIDDQIRI